MRHQLLARLRCHLLLEFKPSLIPSCVRTDFGITSPLSTIHQAQAVLLLDIGARHLSISSQTESINHQKLTTSSHQAFETLREKLYKKSNRQVLVLWTKDLVLGRPYCTGPTGVLEKGIQLSEEEGHSGNMAAAEGSSVGSHRMKDGEILYPVVDTYGPITIRGSELEPGKKKKWCTCGLSKKAPWCDGAHKKTGFKSLKWEVPEKPQSVYQICNCKYTKSPPFCDGTHTNLPEEVLERQKNCPDKPNHEECTKMCTGCGWKVDF